MKAAYFDEPELEFGNGRHIDIRYGLMHHGALDANYDTAHSKIRLGVVGDQESIEQFRKWVDNCRSGISKKPSPLTTMFPAFPGFGDAKPLCDFVVNNQMTRSIPGRELRALAAIEPRNEMVSQSVDRFLSDAFDLYQNSPCDIVICLPSSDLLKAIDTGADVARGPRSRRKRHKEDNHKTVWHDLLKAKAISMNGPIQMVRPATYGGKVHRYRQDGTSSSEIEDEASRAWNFFTALYYKGGGVPWRLPRHSSDLDTCYVGVSYFHETSGDAVQTSVAQVFNERGEGVVVRGGQALVRKNDRTLHMDAETATELLANALVLYKREHKNFPARIVCHKSSYFDEGESEGFRTVADRMAVDQLDLISIRKSSIRFFRNKPNPPLRGTSIELDEKTFLLYTQGSVDFYRAYPGMYIPRAIEVHLDSTEHHSDRILSEMLALTKMNWNSTRFVNAEPITLAAARKVGNILRYVDSDAEIQNRYSYYM